MRADALEIGMTIVPDPVKAPAKKYEITRIDTRQYGGNAEGTVLLFALEGNYVIGFRREASEEVYTV